MSIKALKKQNELTINEVKEIGWTDQIVLDCVGGRNTSRKGGGIGKFKGAGQLLADGAWEPIYKI